MVRARLGVIWGGLGASGRSRSVLEHLGNVLEASSERPGAVLGAFRQQSQEKLEKIMGIGFETDASKP